MSHFYRVVAIMALSINSMFHLGWSPARRRVYHHHTDVTGREPAKFHQKNKIRQLE